MKKALVTGITGQDGSYLVELLLNEGYEVHGLWRRGSTRNPPLVHPMPSNVVLHYTDMTDSVGLTRTILKVKPDEVYHLAAQSDVKVSFDDPVYTVDANALGTVRLLEALRITDCGAHVYFAATSEMFGRSKSPQNETTPFHPESPYAASKLFSYWMMRNYRDSYGMFAANGILFNHESPRRGLNFVTRKITNGIAEVTAGRKEYLELGNLNAQRDWGYAPEYVKAMWLMLQQPKPDDFVIATGETHMVREFVTSAFRYVDIDIRWEGANENEVGVDAKGKTLVKVDARFFRPTDVHVLCGDASKARRILGWKSEVTFEQLVEIMMKAELNRTA